MRFVVRVVQFIWTFFEKGCICIDTQFLFEFVGLAYRSMVRLIVLACSLAIIYLQLHRVPRTYELLKHGLEILPPLAISIIDVPMSSGQTVFLSSARPCI